MRRARHLSDAVVVAQALGDRPRVSERAAAHLEVCARCRRDVADLGSLRAHLARNLPEAGEGVVAGAWALLAPEAPRRSEVDRFAAARLIFDSQEAFAVTGIRAPSASRHLVWRAPGADIDLRLEETGLGSAAGLTGQILPRSRARHPGSGDVWLAERGRPPVWSPLGPNGEFTLPAPRSDRWALWLKWGPLSLRLTPS